MAKKINDIPSGATQKPVKKEVIKPQPVPAPAAPADRSGWFTTALAILACGAAMAAVTIARTHALPALYLFIVSGVLLFAAAPKNRNVLALTGLPEGPAPMQKWEPWYVGLLAALSIFSRFFDLRRFHQGAYGHDNILYGNIETLLGSREFLPHIGGGSDWPTLTYYQGLFFGKIFGWNIGSMKMEAAFWGVLSIIGIYFLIRMLTSPQSAAIISFLFTSSIPHLNFSRTLFPGTILMTAVIVGFFYLLWGVRTGKWHYFLMAGLAAGLSLQGYVPGRGVFLMFLGWMVWMFITNRKNFPSIKNLLLFWGAFALVALPVLIFAVQHPDQYNGYVNSVNPNKGAGLAGYITMIKNQLPGYAGMFHVKGAWDTLFHYPYEPILDPIIGALFPAGLFLCLLSFWRPVPVFMLLFFVGGMMPAILGGGCSPQPDTRRMLIAIPAVYIFGALALERFRLAFAGADGRGKKAAIVTALVAAVTLPVVAVNFKSFIDQQNDPITLAVTEHHTYLAGCEMEKHPDSHVIIMNLFQTASSNLLLPKDYRATTVKEPDQVFLVNPAKGNLLLLEPLFEPLVPVLQEAFPEAVVNVYREQRKERLTKFDGHSFITDSLKYIDIYNPFTYLVSVYVPAADAKRFVNELYAGTPRSAQREDINGDAVARKYAGRAVTLSGALLVESDNAMAKFELGWPGFRLTVDGAVQQRGRLIPLHSGTHYFTLSGTVPGNASGPVPLKVDLNGMDARAAAKVVALKPAAGAKFTFRQGVNRQSGMPDSLTRWSISPSKRFHHRMDYIMPFPVTMECVLTPDADGEYEFMSKPETFNRITVAGKVVYNYYTYGQKQSSSTVMLKGGARVALKAEHMVTNGNDAVRALVVYYRKAGDREWQLLPASWVSQY